MTPDLFIPPVGPIKGIPQSKTKVYNDKYKEIGPFKRHQYDMDICTLYRQVEELYQRGEKFQSFDLGGYVKPVSYTHLTLPTIYSV